MYTKKPENKELYVRKILYTTKARVAFDKVLKLLDFESGKKILLPAYIGYTEREGSGVFDPITSNNLEYDFYEVDTMLSIDFKSFENRVKCGDIKAVLVIHYFGFNCANVIKVKAICEKYGVYLIEDCAHTYHSKVDGKKLGDIGDFSFTSLHKLFPVGNGGALQINNSDFNLSIAELSSDEQADIEVLSLISSYDCDRANERIRSNYVYLHNKIKSVVGVRSIFPILEMGIVPMNYPILISGGLREKLYFYLIERNITVTALYYRLVGEIDKEQYPQSFYLSDSILNLPINQDIELEEIDEMVRVISEFMENEKW
ncbi:DegT/DnrJ/EryC1/StrS family aminotransferase [Shewanella halifaxensis]|uniref:DegT/DnrJ/EryC1/StrS family aminotransferase n=1 Tax=Shewanella halifaxensis TaxID=271098 RepID=UPI000D5924AA|nr:DegT/DnrJ/EryC1/StrS family aminotransferase [Shewanella halifaxensis]